MEIVIKIPNFEWLENEEDFKTAVKEYDQRTKFDKEIRNALINGTPLPEHHGRLIDADRINLHNISPCDDEMLSIYGATVEDIEEAPTIIEGSESE